MKRVVAWEKYENLVNHNLAMAKMMMTGRFVNNSREEGEEDNEDERFRSSYDDDDDEEDSEGSVIMQFPLTTELMQSIKISANFNCWFGHTNFGITESLRDEIEKVEGIEMLKVVTRYRFLVGIGKAFNFTDVRKDLEQVMKVGENNGN